MMSDLISRQDAIDACDELIYITGDFKYCPSCGARKE